jgi:DNA-binding YbaB/EbfC family protein
VTADLPDFDAILRQAREMQEQLASAQAEARERVVEGQSGGGAVKVTVSGTMEFRSVTIDPRAVDPDEVDMLEALVLAALHDAVGRVNELNRQALGGMGVAPGPDGFDLDEMARSLGLQSGDDDAGPAAGSDEGSAPPPGNG